MRCGATHPEWGRCSRETHPGDPDHATIQEVGSPPRVWRLPKIDPGEMDPRVRSWILRRMGAVLEGR